MQASAEGVADGKRIKAEKRKRYQAKQEAKRKLQRKQDNRSEWFENNQEFATFVESCSTAEDTNNSDNIAHFLEPYLNLKDGDKRKGSDQQLFIAEGTETVRILIQQTAGKHKKGMDPVEVKSIFVKPSVLFDEPVHLLQDVLKVKSERNLPRFHVLVGEEETLSNIAGYHISRGALACGVVPERTERWLLDEFLANYPRETQPLRLLAMDGISDTANMGSMIRSASAFGVAAILLSDDCCDAWYRRSVRISMGHVFNVPCVRVENLSKTLKTLREKCNTVSYAAVIDRDADMVLENLPKGAISQSWCCVMGNEGNGISSNVVAASTHSLRIDMDPEVDSLSVPIATGIILHGLKEREGQTTLSH